MSVSMADDYKQRIDLGWSDDICIGSGQTTEPTVGTTRDGRYNPITELSEREAT